MRVLLAPLGDPGYLYPTIAIGRRLRGRGADVWLVGETRSTVVAASAGVPLLNCDTYGVDRPFRTHRWFLAGGEQYRATVRAAREVAPDVIVTSVLCHGALLAAERLDLPCVVVGLATHLWPYASGGEDEDQSAVLRQWRLAELLRRYTLAVEQSGLPARRDRPTQSTLIGAALLLRGDAGWEYPGAVLPPGVHHVGSCWWEPSAPVEDCDAIRVRLAGTGKPVAYVHLGRTFGGGSLWPRLNAMFTGGRYQAVVERGRSGQPDASPGADITVVRKPWMGPLLAMADVVLTNATSAPVLGAVRYDRPLIVAPNGSEQPVLAAACVRVGIARTLPERVDAGTVAALVPPRTPAAVPVGDGGAEHAARLVESVANGRTLAA